MNGMSKTFAKKGWIEMLKAFSLPRSSLLFIHQIDLFNVIRATLNACKFRCRIAVGGWMKKELLNFFRKRIEKIFSKLIFLIEKGFSREEWIFLACYRHFLPFCVCARANTVDLCAGPFHIWMRGKRSEGREMDKCEKVELELLELRVGC